MTRVIVAPVKHDCEHLLGQFLDESHYDLLVDEDCDFYAPPSALHPENGEHNILFKLRKGVFSADEQLGAYNGLHPAAQMSHNRGLAAGPKGKSTQNSNQKRHWVHEWEFQVLEAMIDSSARLSEDGEAIDNVKWLVEHRDLIVEDEARGYTWAKNKIEAVQDPNYDGWFERWVASVIDLPAVERKAAAESIMKKYIATTSYANPVRSGIAGYFDRYPRIPYGRATSYTESYPEFMEMAFPYLHKLDDRFRELLPERWANQRAAADKLDRRFSIDGTVFTTVTVNKTFRTAAHRDAGDLTTGFSNLGVVTNGKDYRGGYLVLPEYRVAINVRPGDVLLINNHEGIHGNTPIDGDEGFERVSLVCYFREPMLQLGSYEYEDARFRFIESRRLNLEHPGHVGKTNLAVNCRWNGISPGWSESQEWYDFLKAQPDGPAMLAKYHPEAGSIGSLEDFFV